MNTGYIFEIQNSQDMVDETDFYFDLDVGFSAKIYLLILVTMCKERFYRDVDRIA